MFDINNIRNFAAAITVSAGLLISCAGLDEQQSQTVGYLAAPSLDVDVTVDNLVQTKAWNFDIPQPSVEDINIVVKDKDGKEKYNGKGFWSSPLVMPVGAYTIDAVSGTNTFGAPYLKGHISGTIAPLEQNSPEQLTLSLENALVKVTVSEELTAHFTPAATLLLKSGSDTYTADYGQWAYVPSGADLALELSGTNKAGNGAKFSYSLTSPSPKKAYSVVCGLDKTDWPSISLKVKPEDAWLSRIYITEQASFSGSISKENEESVVYEAIPASSDWGNMADIMTAEPEENVYVFKELAPGEYKVRARVGALVSNVVAVNTALDVAKDMTVTATHTYTSGDLDGTDVSMTLNKSTYIKNAVSQWNLDLYNAAGGNALRSELAVDAVSDGSEITSGWPFLPTGGGEGYILNAGLVMDGTEYTMSPSVAFTNQPTFTVTASGYTTYDKYRDYLTSKSAADLSAANQEGKAEYIFQISSSVTISENLLNNPNYTKKVYYTCGPYTDIAYDFVNGEGDTDTAVKVHNIGDVGGFSWGQNTLTAGVSFAGTRCNSAGDVCHITGLPYKSPDLMTSSVTIGSAVTDWATTGTVEFWSGRGYQILKWYLGGVTAGTLYSPQFQVPSNTNISYSSSACYWTTGSTSWPYDGETVTLYSGSTATLNKSTANSKSVDRISVTVGQAPSASKFTSFSHNSVLMPNGRISLGSDETKDNNLAENWVTIGYLNVSYN